MRLNFFMKKIATIYTDFPEKFGIPRQSGLLENKAVIIFEKEYSCPQAFVGLEGFSHLWLIWEFSLSKTREFSPSVRPPLLGGNKKMGVFATRSPFRPNPIGLSVVKLLKVEKTKDKGVVLHVEGADIVNGTSIFDVKPYLPYADKIENAVGGWTENLSERKLNVEISPEFLKVIDGDNQAQIIKLLQLDPRPSYVGDERSFGLNYAGYEISFVVKGKVLTVTKVERSVKN